MTTHRSMVISLIGRPNVGKSTIFNRLMKKAHKAITHDRPGVTRDRHYGIATLDEKGEDKAIDAILVDTGGFYPQRIEENVAKKNDQIMNKFFNIMTDQAKMAIDESDLVLFAVDVREGLLPFDQSIADYLRTKNKKFWLVVNKFDTEKQRGDELEFYSLGIEENQMYVVSAEHGIGLHELRLALHQEAMDFEAAQLLTLPTLSKGVTPREKVVARVSLIGAPNAGKSTLLNQFLGSQRALVSDIPGTTVDPIEGFFDLYFGEEVKELDKEMKVTKDDHLLLKQYDDFRKNNSDVYQSMLNAYNQELVFNGELPVVEDDLELMAEAGINPDDLRFDEEGEIYPLDSENEEVDEAELLAESESHDPHQIEAEEDYLYQQVFGADESAEKLEEDDSELELNAEAAEVANEDHSNHWRSIHLVDTAGIRKKGQIKGFIEEQSVYRSLRCITESDIVIYMIDATIGIGHQDRRLLDISLEKGKSVIICMNKIDLLKDKLKDEKAKKEWIKELRGSVPWLYFCDIIPISAKYSKHLGQLRKVLKKTVLVRRRTIPTGQLNRYVYHLIEKHPIVAKNAGGKRFKVKYTTMVKTNPPTFVFFTNKSKDIPENYRSYLKNGLRSEFPLDNTPIHLVFRTGEDLVKRLQKRMKLVE